MEKNFHEEISREIDFATKCKLTISYQKNGFSISVSNNESGYNVARSANGNLQEVKFGLSLDEASDCVVVWAKEVCEE